MSPIEKFMLQAASIEVAAMEIDATHTNAAAAAAAPSTPPRVRFEMPKTPTNSDIKTSSELALRVHDVTRRLNRFTNTATAQLNSKIERLVAEREKRMPKDNTLIPKGDTAKIKELDKRRELLHLAAHLRANGIRKIARIAKTIALDIQTDGQSDGLRSKVSKGLDFSKC